MLYMNTTVNTIVSTEQIHSNPQQQGPSHTNLHQEIYQLLKQEVADDSSGSHLAPGDSSRCHSNNQYCCVIRFLVSFFLHMLYVYNILQTFDTFYTYVALIVHGNVSDLFN